MPLTGYVLTETESHMPTIVDTGMQTDADIARMNTLDTKNTVLFTIYRF